MIADARFTAAQLVFLGASPFNFARIVSDINSVLDRSLRAPAQATWDCDDFVTFDLGFLRLILCCAETKEGAAAAQVTLFAALSQDKAHAPAAAVLEPLSDLLVARLCDRLAPDDVTRADQEGNLTIDSAEALGLRMFNAAKQRLKQNLSEAADLRNPLSDTEVASCFGRMPLVQGLKPVKKDRVAPHRLAPQTLAGLVWCSLLRLGNEGLKSLVLLVWLPISTGLYVHSATVTTRQIRTSELQTVQSTISGPVSAQFLTVVFP